MKNRGNSLQYLFYLISCIFVLIVFFGILSNPKTCMIIIGPLLAIIVLIVLFAFLPPFISSKTLGGKLNTEVNALVEAEIIKYRYLFKEPIQYTDNLTRTEAEKQHNKYLENKIESTRLDISSKLTNNHNYKWLEEKYYDLGGTRETFFEWVNFRLKEELNKFKK